MGLLSRVMGNAAETAAPKGLLSRALPAAALGGALGGTLLLSSPDAMAQDAPDLVAAQSRIAELEQDLKTFDSGSAEDVQKTLLRKGFPLKRVDGKIGPETASAIGQYRQQTLDELEKARARLKDAETQAAYASTQASPEHEALREFGPWAATAAGLALGVASRGGAVKKAATQAAKKIAEADALLTPGAVVMGKNMASPRGLTIRAANINEFWRLGGADGQVPFAVKSTGEWRPKPGATSPSDLFPAAASKFRANDYGMVGSGVAEAGLSAGAWVMAQNELEAAQVAADAEPSAANLARLERARDMLKIAESAARLGLGFAGGRAFGALKMPYSSARPNIPGAEAERALLLDAIQRTRTS